MTYRVIPHRRSYCIEAVAKDGTRRGTETFPTERAALERLKVLRDRVDTAWERRKLRDWHV